MLNPGVSLSRRMSCLDENLVPGLPLIYPREQSLDATYEVDELPHWDTHLEGQSLGARLESPDYPKGVVVHLVFGLSN